MMIFVPIVKGSPAIVLFLFIFLIIFNLPSTAGANSSGNAQDTSRLVVIHSITIDGNLRTRSSIILRELPFHELDTIRQTPFRQMLIAGQENIFNTALFTFVTL